MAKIRVYQLAKQLEVSNKDLLDTIRELGLEVKSHMSVVDEDSAERIAAAAKKPPSVVKDSKAAKAKAVPAADKKKDKAVKEKAAPAADKKKDKAVKEKAAPAADKKKDKAVKEKAAPATDEEKDKKEPKKEKKQKKGKKKTREPEPPPEVEVEKPPVGPIALSEGITVKELSERLGVKVSEIIRNFMKKGKMVVVNQFLDFETARSLVEEMGFQYQEVSLEVEGLPEESAENLSPRAPVVTIMGHVDHGKTSLLDVIRESSITEKESGGITQHIGAYHVEHPKGTIVFLDTPGHEAFTAMRSRGAKVTDIVVLVVAADDGVMPQTIEALDHAKAAEVPIIVAVNKIDKPNAKPDTVRTQLAERDLLPEDWGGQTIFVDVSAKKKIGLETLLEMILLQAEVMELKANPDKPCRGTVVESKLDRGRGPVATVLVQDGTLRTGDYFVTGTNYGRVRAILNEKGEALADAPPITPVEILGLSGVPAPGDSFQVVPDERKARQVAALRLQRSGPAAAAKPTRLSLKDLFSKISKGEAKELPLVVKGDVQGTVEALSASLVKLSTAKVKVRVIHRGVGTINEGDILLASASSAVIIGFNVRPEPKVSEMAVREGLDMRFYNIIYKATEDIQKAMLGLLDPTYREEAQGRAEVRDTFSVPRIGLIAGCGVLSGKMVRNAEVRVIRDGVVVYEGRISSLRRFKDDVKEVSSGYECGVGVSNFNDIKKGDIIESFVQVEEKPTL